jgi:hypothetical protein
MVFMTADATFRPFALERPCGNCPFRADRTPSLDRGRAQDIADSLHADASGVGGAAMTWFRMTILHSDTAMLLFASTQFGDQFYGAAPFDAAILAAPKVEDFNLFTASRN